MTSLRSYAILIGGLVILCGFTNADFRLISREDLLASAHSFTEPGVVSYSQLLFDISRNQMIVGARDALYRLSLWNLKLLEKSYWPASPNKTSLCLEKGQSEEDCHNYIKVLLTNGKRLFACGTSAFNPECSWRDMDNINQVQEWVKGVAKCPFSPKANITALLTIDGSYFIGSPMDFSGTDSAIYRSMTPVTLRTNQFNSKWLNDPDFVGSFEADNFVYFIFRETAVEYINCGKIMYSRVARVCKNDTGGGPLMLRENWTTFVKARINCSLPGEYPFYFDEIQGVYYLEDEGLIYATFTTPSNSIAGSVICVFNMSAINAAFSGPYKHQDRPGSAWERHHVPHKSLLECQISPDTHQLLESSRYQLMDSAVQPATLSPLYFKELETLTHITVDRVSTKLHRSVHILYVATIEGIIKKISVLPHTMETCVVELWKPFEDSFSPVRTLHYLKETNSVYVGGDSSLLQIKAQHCSRFKTMVACLNAMDPYCGWNNLKELCTLAPDGDPLAKYWLQNFTQCPVLSHPVDGSWSSWSSWFPCGHHSYSDASAIEHDKCLCSTRQCNNPAPQNGGAACVGMSMKVTNCTVHGGWTAWSAWSACSQTCGTAVKTKRRTCGNPAPAHGGRVCVGHDRSEIYCTSNPPCPVLTPLPRDGQWGSWSEWGPCSAVCGGGYRVRKRVCDSPTPENGGQDCQGCHLDYEGCNTHSCVEGKKHSAWTPWLQKNNTYDGQGYVEQRFRFMCRAPVDASVIKITQAKEEERFCHSNANCPKTSSQSDSEDDWSEWSAWSPCSVNCGGGQQFRTRTCGGEKCDGSSQESRQCNTHKCNDEWSCWSEWSGCSVSCGHGIRQRTRNCMKFAGYVQQGHECDGPSVTQEHCEMMSCESLRGWEAWSLWSLCDENGMQHRQRKCQYANPTSDMCQGPTSESRMCIRKDGELDHFGDVGSLDSHSSSNVPVPVVLGSCTAAFTVGIVLAALLCYFCLRKRRSSVAGSPHYISSKQNPYVTVPLKEVGVHAKRSPCSSSTSSNTAAAGSNTSSGLALGKPKLFTKPVEYETATIKRNSHSLVNGHMRMDLDQDNKFF